MKEIVQGRDSLVAKESKNRLVHWLLLASLQGTQCVQVVHLTHNQAIHCPEDGVDVREPNPAAQKHKGSVTDCSSAKLMASTVKDSSKKQKGGRMQTSRLFVAHPNFAEEQRGKRAAYHQPGMLG